MSTNVVVAHESIADELESKLSQKLADLQATKDGVFVRGLFSSASADRARALIKDAQDKGAKVQGGKDDESTSLVQPRLVTQVTKDMDIYKNEHFSPLLNLVRFKTDEEAIDIANSSEYGLAAAVYSKDEGHAYRIASQIDAGMVHVNGATIHDTQTLPHGVSRVH